MGSNVNKALGQNRDLPQNNDGYSHQQTYNHGVPKGNRILLGDKHKLQLRVLDKPVRQAGQGRLDRAETPYALPPAKA